MAGVPARRSGKKRPFLVGPDLVDVHLIESRFDVLVDGRHVSFWVGTALVDVLVNPDEPPMPGKVEYEQVQGFLASQPRKATITSTLFRDKVTEMRY